MLKYFVRARVETQQHLRAAGMLEYMLIALISLAAFIFIRAAFPDFIDGLWTNITDAIGTNDPNATG